ncbi:DUF695 domain-containing protein [Hymenobacter busanensis]|uniref:DUF695 domain-containing protein n=1 Tax=Hymenobacter busanensis TaxID=2607656 RepID=A0A7L4ZWU2_9BACT|nr:DUF695 domain-containing protein [Hymenobacter busanensis]KAA9332337.1 DUF695 domain-containing protein [Hymenobacter busanensis]QHJ07326.1 DUF695 domain-containing protein [Hymenobacter busanensis]
MKVYSLFLLSLLSLHSACTAQSDETPPENWCIQKATDQDRNDVFITANLGYKDYAHKADFPWCIAVNITTVNKNPGGYPTRAEAPVLDATEDIITEALRKAGAVQYVGRVTVKGYRELYYFVPDPEKANTILTRLTKEQQPRAWEYEIDEDAKWERVASFFSGTPNCL